MSLTGRVHQVLKTEVERTVMAMVVALGLALTLAVICRPVAEVAVHVAPAIVMVRAHSSVLRNLVKSGKSGKRHRYQNQSIEETVAPGVSRTNVWCLSTSSPRTRRKKKQQGDVMGV